MTKKFNPNSDEGWLEVSDVSAFAEYIRNLVYVNFKEDELNEEQLKQEEWEHTLTEELKNLSQDEMEEMENVLDKNECASIIKEDCKKIRNKRTQEVKYIMNDTILYDMIDHVNQRMISNIISKLVKQGLLETAFDTEKNEFIFWKAEDNNGDSQTDKF